MTDRLLKVYHLLPNGMRSAAASVRGLHLRLWRFGRESKRLVEEMVEHEGWGEARWRAWQEERLAYVLHRAATEVPYYRDQWAERRRRGDRSSWERLENWPVLEKEALRANAPRLVAEGCNPRRMFQLHTSGTTGKPVSIWKSRKMMRSLYALSAARSMGWHGLTLNDRWARLGGKLVIPAGQRLPPFWVWNASLKQLYMSTYHLAPDLSEHYLDALKRYRIRYLFGYTSALFALAQEALRLGRRDIGMKVVMTDGEPLLEHQRQVIAEAFQCPARETYGMGESVVAATECPRGTLHQWPELGWLEVLAGAGPAAPGEYGDFVATSLLNTDMPLVRYRVGDRGRLLRPGPACGCGRKLPGLEVVEAGSYDLFVTADGRRIFGLEDVFFSTPVRQVQVVQERLDLIRALYVPAPGFTAESARFITEGVRARMGQVEVILEQVREIPRGANGKFWIQICKVPEAEREAVLQARRRLSRAKA